MSDTETEQSAVSNEQQEMEQIRRSVEALAAKVDRSIEDDRFKDEQIRRLHAELQEYKRGLFDQALLPLLTQLIRLHENLDRQERALRQKPPEELGPERLFKELAGIREELEVILGESGVAIFEHPSNVYEPARQVARETVTTGEAALHGTICQRLFPGYERDGRLVSKERVKVYAHRPGPSAEKTPEKLD